MTDRATVSHPNPSSIQPISMVWGSSIVTPTVTAVDARNGIYKVVFPSGCNRASFSISESVVQVSLAQPENNALGGPDGGMSHVTMSYGPSFTSGIACVKHRSQYDVTTSQPDPPPAEPQATLRNVSNFEYHLPASYYHLGRYVVEFVAMNGVEGVSLTLTVQITVG